MYLTLKNYEKNLKKYCCKVSSKDDKFKISVHNTQPNHLEHYLLML